MSVFVFVVEEAFDLPCLPQDYKDEIEIGKLVEFCNKRLTESFVFTAKRKLDENFRDLKLGESLCIFIFFLFSESGLYLLNGFDFYFEWRDTENQQLSLLKFWALVVNYKCPNKCVFYRYYGLICNFLEFPW